MKSRDLRAGPFGGRRSASLALALMGLHVGSTLALGACPSATVIADTAAADSILVAFQGRSWGEVVSVSDTVVSSVTMWEAANQFNNPDGGQLYITAVDSNGVPDVHLDRILLAGPVVLGPGGDGINPIALRFVLDPPFVLPGPGRYFFCVKEWLCVGSIALLADTMNAYVDGEAWRTRPTFDCSNLGGPRSGGEKLDLLFKIEFCDVTTPVRRATWGSLKIRYR